MNKTRYVFLVTTLIFGIAQVSCFSENVHLYVDVDDSCKTCCADQQFEVFVGGVQEGVIGAGNEIMAERRNGTGDEALEVIISTDDNIPESSRQHCQQCITSKISDDKYPDNNGLLYALYDDDVHFTDEDLSRSIRCEQPKI